MAFNPEESIQALCGDFQTLVDFASDPSPRSAQAVEAHLFNNLLKLGAQLLRLYFQSQAQEQPKDPLPQADGPALRYHGQRRRSYFSVFGKIHFERAYFYAAGAGGATPLDQALDLPEDCYSGLLCDWACFAVTDQSYGASQALFEHMLGVRLPKLALERIVERAAAPVAVFYKHKPPPPTDEEGPILVVQADGKGVPMVAPSSAQVRRGKGDKRTKKQEAVVTALYSVDPYRRSPQQVVAALMRQGEQGDTAARPVPQSKHVWATLAGKDTALAHLAEQARKRDGAHIVDRVALTDGAIALQQRVVAQLPEFTLVLDVIHAVEYLWKAANALLGEGHQGRTAWVSRHLEALLSGAVTEVIAALENDLASRRLCASRREAVETTMGYYRRNAPYMRYDVYLRRGWPIGSGVVEGACGHLVKDRMEQSGMRWSPAGAQSVLDLRSVRLNGDWSLYQGYLQQGKPACGPGEALVTPLVPSQPELRCAA
jgi:hypothetical protein